MSEPTETAARRKRRSHGEGSVYQTAQGTWRGAVLVADPVTGRQARRYVSGRTADIVRSEVRRLRDDAERGVTSAGPRLTTAQGIVRMSRLPQSNRGSHLLGIVLAGIAGFGGAVLASWITARQARADRDEARRNRFADQRLTLAVDFLGAADDMVQASQDRVDTIDNAVRLTGENNPDAPTVPGDRQMRVAYRALEIVAPDVSRRALEVVIAATFLRGEANTWSGFNAPEPGYREERHERWRNGQGDWVLARIAFIEGISANLGVSMDDI